MFDKILTANKKEEIYKKCRRFWCIRAAYPTCILEDWGCVYLEVVRSPISMLVMLIAKTDEDIVWAVSIARGENWVNEVLQDAIEGA